MVQVEEAETQTRGGVLLTSASKDQPTLGKVRLAAMLSNATVATDKAKIPLTGTKRCNGPSVRQIERAGRWWKTQAAVHRLWQSAAARQTTRAAL